jgi:hypothetical protein
MSLAARKRAERCFALARSTTFAPERDNAVRMGTKIAEDAGLDLDSFDIPGRQRATRKPGEGVHYSTSGRSFTTAEFEAALEATLELVRAGQRAQREAAFYSAREAARRPRYCPNGAGMLLFGDECGCPICERQRRAGESRATVEDAIRQEQERLRRERPKPSFYNAFDRCPKCAGHAVNRETGRCHWCWAAR